MRFLISLLLCGYLLPGAAQQLPLFSQYREYGSYINPAMLNSDYLRGDYHLSVGISARSQWSSQPLAPRTQFLRGEYITDNGAWAFGAHLINDQAGPSGFSGAFLRAGGIINFDRYGTQALVVGLSGGLVQHRIQGSKVALLERSDLLGGVDQGRIIPDMGVGIYYHGALGGGRRRSYSGGGGDYVYAGVSIPQVFGLDLTYKAADGEFAFNRVWHYYAVAGMYKYVGNSAFIEPSVWVRYVDGTPLGVDFNLRGYFQEFVWVGAGLGTSGMLNLEAGVILGEIQDNKAVYKIGYSYGRSYQEFGPSFGLTHEINLVYLTGKKR